MTASVPAGRIRSFFAGVGDLGRGFAYWRRLPRAMALGLIPAGIVGAVLLAGLITLAVFLHDIVDALTRFADGWAELGASLIRLGIGAAIMGGAIVLAIVSFTALTLLVGDPFYERIWRAVEADLGGPAPTSEYGFWRSVGDSVGLVLRGILAAVLAFLLGLIPVVGGAVAAVAAAFLTGWLLADELTSRALTARGLDAAARRRLRRSHRARVLGFGVATQLCFLVPLGAVVAMPAAVAGSTRLARHLQEGEATIHHAEARDRGSAAQNGA